MPLENQEHKLRIIEDGVKSEFWKITTGQVTYINMVDMQGVIDLHWHGEHEKAKIMALQIKARQEVISEPGNIIRNVKPKYDEYDFNAKKWVKKAVNKVTEIFKSY